MQRPAALITGAASGIGLALAEELVARGYDVTALDLDAAALGSAERSLSARRGGGGGGAFVPFAADVTDAAAQQRAFREHMARFGRLDLAVLNAGIGERGDFLLEDPSSTAHHKCLDIDLTAAIEGVRLATHCMVGGGGLALDSSGGGGGGGGGGGCIVAIASAAGIFPVPAGPIYAAAKGGLVHFMRSVAPRLAARGVTAAAVCPQYVDTPLVANMLRDNPAAARAMMGPLFGAPLLAPSQVVDLVLSITDARAALAAGAGVVHLLLQNGRAIDPFAPRPRRAAPGAPPASAAPPPSTTLARFPPAALAAFAGRQLPGSYLKLRVARLSPDFRAATEIVSEAVPARSELPAGGVLVRRLYAGVNASDINYTSGRYHGSTAAAERALPFDAGFESVGVVVAAAPDVQGFPPGTPVATMDRGFSEFGVHPTARAMRVPAPTPEVLALLTSGLTASIALEVSAGLRLPPPFAAAAAPATAHTTSAAENAASRPRTVLVTAAAGGTGQFAVQLARLAGCRVVATCGGPDKAALLRRLGVDRVIDYRAEDVKGVLKAEYPGGIDVIYESVGGQMFDICVDALADRGTLVVIGMMSAYGSGWKRSVHEGLAEKLLWKSARVAGFFLLKHAPLWGPHMAALCELLAQGRLQAAIDPARFVGVRAAAAAVDRLQSGASSGKVVLQVCAELPAGGGGGGAPAARM